MQVKTQTLTPADTTDTTQLSSRAMLVRLNITQWSARRQDKKITEEVRQKYHADIDAGRYNKALLAKSALQDIKRIAGHARTLHYTYTLPWRDDGARILSSAMFMEYSSHVRKLQEQYSIALQTFLANYATYVNESRIRLNSMFDVMDYPTQETVGEKFSFSVSVDPLPTAGDFRVDLLDEHVQAIKSDIEDRTKHAINLAMSDLWKRLYDAVNHIVDRLSSSDNIFRDSMIGNIRELCSLLPKLNITNDANLEKMRLTIEQKFANKKPDEIRNSDTERQKTIVQANEILDAMRPYMTGDTQETKVQTVQPL